MGEDSHIDPRLVGCIEAIYQDVSSRKNTTDLDHNALHKSEAFNVGYESNYFKSALW